MAKAPVFKLPKSLAACADMLYTTRQERLDVQKKVDEFKEREELLRTHIINTLPKSEASGISGKIANAKIVTKDVPRVEDWDAFYKYVHKNQAYELLQRRLNDAGIQERWDDDKTVPGVGKFTTVSVSVTKV